MYHFFLADRRLQKIEDEWMDVIETETDEGVLSYLRHETEEWRKMCGPFSRPYQNHYAPNPFSDQFVHHLSGW